MKKLNILRQEIDKIDKKILKLLKQRLQIVEKIGLWKRQNKKPVLDNKRWGEVLRSKMRLGKKLGLNEILIKEIYYLIHKEALEIENNL